MLGCRSTNSVKYQHALFGPITGVIAISSEMELSRENENHK